MDDPRAWRVISSRTIVHDRWIKLRADDCETPDGVRVSPFYVLDYPDWVQIVALSPQGEVLLVEQYRHGAGIVSLEIPAGGMDAADADPVAAARRELLEETGCTGQAARVIGTLSPNPASHANRIHTVLVEGVRHVQAPKADPAERIATRWVTVDEALSAARDGRIIASLQLASLFLGLEAAGRIGIVPRGS